MSILAANVKTVWSKARREILANRLVAHIRILCLIVENTLLSLPTDLLRTPSHHAEKCMYAQIDSEGNQHQSLSEVTDHRSDNPAIKIHHELKRKPYTKVDNPRRLVSVGLVEGWIIGLVTAERLKGRLSGPNCRICCGNQNCQ
jgi:hypothetical protein